MSFSQPINQFLSFNNQWIIVNVIVVTLIEKNNTTIIIEISIDN
jgi:hypothetical protein